MEKKVLVLAGGASPEREVSLAGGEAVASALAKRGYDTLILDPARAGFPARISRLKDIYAVFIVLHGAGGEDGAIQGFLETLGLPYTGSGVAAGALAIDKRRAKTFFIAHGLPTPPFCGPEDLPLVVKPAHGGSTLGITVVREPSRITAAVAEAERYDRDIFMEKFVPGTEITVSILGNRVPAILPSIEIVAAGGFYDYQAKYSPGGSRHIIPPRLDPAVVSAAEQVVLDAHRALGCRGFSRSEVIVDGQGKPWLLEVNTIPGFTATSLFPDAAAAAGISFPELVEKLVEMAREE